MCEDQFIFRVHASGNWEERGMMMKAIVMIKGVKGLRDISEDWTESEPQTCAEAKAQYEATLESDEELQPNPAVHGPAHYDGDECMIVIEACPSVARGGCLFNIAKYLWRAGAKDRAIQDVEKALWYATRFSEHNAYGQELNKEEKEMLSRCIDHGVTALQASDPEGRVAVCDAISTIQRLLMEAGSRNSQTKAS